MQDISFGTLHVYPESMGIPFSALGGTDNFTWANEYFIKARAAATAALGKPFIVEEFGQTPDYGNTSGLSNPRSVALLCAILAVEWGQGRPELPLQRCLCLTICPEHSSCSLTATF